MKFIEEPLRAKMIQKLCLPRADGWVANARPDKETQEYLCFPGN